MQNTSALWKNLAASGTAALIATAEVNGTPYELAQAPAVARAMLDGQSFVGNAVAATLQIALRTVDDLPKSAEVALSIQLTDGTDTTEAIPAGTYYISKRSTNPEAGVTTLLCYDAMLKGNAPYVPASVPSGGLPMSDAVAEIASAMGVAVDSRTAINAGTDYVLTSFPAGMTMRDVLAKIAAVHGGNWVITPANALRLVPLVSSAGAGSATENVVDVIGVLGSLSVSPTVTISGFKWMLDGVEQLTGTDAGIVLDLTSAPVTAGIAAALGTSLVGISYQPFSAPAAVYDPAAEIGDYVVRRVTVDDTTTTYVESVLCSEAASYSPACRVALSAPMPAEIADEYPFTGGAAKTLAQAEAYADEAVQALDTALTQEEVFNRLTDNGAAQGLFLSQNGQLYINASYLQVGTITGSDGKNYWVLDGNNPIFVTKKGVIGDFTLENGVMYYGDILSGGAGTYISKDGVAYEQKIDNNNQFGVQLNGGGLSFRWNGAERTTIYMVTDGAVVKSIGYDDTLYFPVVLYNRSDGYRHIDLNFDTSINGNFSLNGKNVVTGVKGNSETDYRTGDVNITPANMGLDSLVKTVHYTYAYNASANSVVTITANDMGVSTPTGYTPVGLMVISTGSGNCFCFTCNAGRTGNSTIMQIKNTSANAVSATAQLDILYIKSAFV